MNEHLLGVGLVAAFGLLNYVFGWRGELTALRDLKKQIDKESIFSFFFLAVKIRIKSF